jgi:hypothetical protein
MFWLMIVVIPVACMVPVLFFKAMRRWAHAQAALVHAVPACLLA